MKKIILAVAVLGLCAGCTRRTEERVIDTSQAPATVDTTTALAPEGATTEYVGDSTAVVAPIDNARRPASVSSNPAMNSQDQDLAKRVQASLTEMKASATVSAVNGVVTIDGIVASQAEKDMIGRQVKAMAGVTAIDNKLSVRAENL